MKFLAMALVTIAVCSGSFVHALEMSAYENSVQRNVAGVSAKVDATLAIVTSALNKILACQKVRKFYNPDTGTCVAGEGMDVVVVHAGGASTGDCQACGTKNSSKVTADLCMISHLGIGGYGWTRTCAIVQSGAREWYAQVYSNNNNNSMSCNMTCFNFKSE
jgi:hypothetical protein